MPASLSPLRRVPLAVVIGVPGRSWIILLKGDLPGGSRRGGKSNNGRSYKPGDIVRESGIFEVLHDREHRASHEVVMVAGNAFPPCDTCKDRVRFRLVRTAPYIFRDQDFEDEEP